MANKKNSISDALQLGSTIRLSSGADLPILGACPIKKLESVIDLFDKIAGVSTFAYLYVKGHEEEREAFYDLLYIMCDEKVEKDKFEDMFTTADYEEVRDAILRFLGFKPRDAATQTQQE